jgi:glycosyltransferase involved in cell wall biosynthesis
VGLDLGPFLAATEAEGQAFRREMGAGPDDTVAVFVGRLVPIKRVDLLLEAVALAREAGTSVQLAVVGDGRLRSKLQHRADGLELDRAVRFLGYRHDLPAINAGADLAVLSSDNEGTPVSLIEAAAAGRPAVATEVGGVGDIVTSRSGRLVPAGDPRSFAAALCELAQDPERRRELGREARERVRETFSADRLLDDVSELYAELLAERAGAGRP